MGRGSRLGIGRSFGIVALAFATYNVRFPARKQELMRLLENRKILWTSRRTIDVGKILRESDTTVFGSFADLLAVIAHYEDRHVHKLTEFVNHA